MCENLSQLVQDLGGNTIVIPTSKHDFFGIEDIYTEIQLQFEGGEDLMKD